MTKMAIAVVAAAILSGCAGCSGKLAKCKKAAGQVADGTLSPDAQGVVALPPDLAGATVDGRAYVTAMPSGRQWVLFRTWQGRGADLDGYLYTAGDIPSVGAEVWLVSLAPDGVRTIDVRIDESLGQSWYGVSRRMD